MSLTRSPAAETAERVTVGFVRADLDYAAGRGGGAWRRTRRSRRTDADGAADRVLGGRGAGDRRALAERGADGARQPGCALPPSRLAITAGRSDRGRLGGRPTSSASTGSRRRGIARSRAVRVEPGVYEAPVSRARVAQAPAIAAPSPVDVEFLDLPLLTRATRCRTRRMSRWRGSPGPGRSRSIRRATTSATRFDREVRRPAVIGEPLDPLPAGCRALDARRGPGAPRSGSLQSRSEADVLNGANVAALRFGTCGDWEVFQFRDAPSWSRRASTG